MKTGSFNIFSLALALAGASPFAAAQIGVDPNTIVNVGEITEGANDIVQGAQGKPDDQECGNECETGPVAIGKTGNDTVNVGTITEGVNDIVGALTLGNLCGGQVPAAAIAPLTLNLGSLGSNAS